MRHAAGFSDILPIDYLCSSVSVSAFCFCFAIFVSVLADISVLFAGDTYRSEMLDCLLMIAAA